MRQVAEIVCAFPQELPCVVISAMGKTTNMLLEAGSQAITKGTDNVPSLKPLRGIKDLHRDTCSRLDLSDTTVSQVEKLLTELQQLLIGLSIMQVCYSLLVAELRFWCAWVAFSAQSLPAFVICMNPGHNVCHNLCFGCNIIALTLSDCMCHCHPAPEDLSPSSRWRCNLLTDGLVQEMTPRAKDSLVSFGERLSSRIFAGYLSRLGVKASQFDAWNLGMQTTEEFTNAEILYELSLPAVGSSLKAYVQETGSVPVVTGFVGKAASSGNSYISPPCIKSSHVYKCM